MRYKHAGWLAEYDELVAGHRFTLVGPRSATLQLCNLGRHVADESIMAGYREHAVRFGYSLHQFGRAIEHSCRLVESRRRVRERSPVRPLAELVEDLGCMLRGENPFVKTPFFDTAATAMREASRDVLGHPLATSLDVLADTYARLGSLLDEAKGNLRVLYSLERVKKGLASSSSGPP